MTYDEWCEQTGRTFALGNALCRAAFNAGVAARAPEAVGGEVRARAFRSAAQVVRSQGCALIDMDCADVTCARLRFVGEALLAIAEAGAPITPATPSPVAEPAPCSRCGDSQARHIGMGGGCLECMRCDRFVPTPSPVGARETGWLCAPCGARTHGDNCHRCGAGIDHSTRGAPTEAEARRHKKKCWPDEWDDIYEGRKTFEFRREDDCRYEVGDVLTLAKWSPFQQQYLGEILDVRVTSVLRDAFGVPPGYVVLSIKPMGLAPSAPDGGASPKETP